MKKTFIIQFIIVIAFMVGATKAYAVGAYPHPISVQQPDGSTIMVCLHGDEFFSYTTTTSGDLIARKADGFYYYASFAGTQIQPSTRKAVSTSRSTTKARPLTLPNAVKQLIQQRRLESSTTATNASRPYTSKGTPRDGNTIESLVILVEFSDLSFSSTKPEADFTRMLNQNGYAENGATGSARDFYVANSMGKMDFNFVVSPVVKLKKSWSHYGMDKDGRQDINIIEFVKEACDEAYKKGVDFSRFDYDNDGMVDNIFFYYAGHNQAEGGHDNTIWPHKWEIANNTIYNGKKMRLYACSSELRMNRGAEMAGIGTFCHEFGHVLGLPDLYDTDGEENGSANPYIEQIALMGAGNYLNNGRTPPYLSAIEREIVDWLTPETITNKGDYGLESIDKNMAYRIESGNPNEYFLIEHRNKEGWDKYLPGTGLVVYHIDKSSNTMPDGRKAADVWKYNAPNNYANHPCADVLISNSELSPDYFYPGNSNRTDLTMEAWNSRIIPQSLTNITNQGGRGTFSILISETTTCRGKVTNSAGMPINGADIYIVKQDPQENSRAQLKALSLQATSRANISELTTTNEQGQFSFEHPSSGTYTYIIAKQGYLNGVGEIEILNGDNVLNVALIKQEEKKGDLVIWGDQNYPNMLTGGGPTVYVGQRWESSDLQKYIRKQIQALNVVSVIAADVEVGVKINDVDKYTKKVRIREGYNDINISDAGLLIQQGEELMVYVKYTNVGTGVSTIYLSGGVVPGKGDLYSQNGKEWSSLSDIPINSNVAVGFYATEQSVSCTPLQQDAYFDFKQLNPKALKATLTITDMKTLKKLTYNCGETNIYLARGLESYTAYRYALTIDGEQSSVEGEFITSKALSEFAALYETKESYAEGDVLPLAVINTPDGVQSVKWYVDGVEYNDPIITLTQSITLEAVITYAPNDTERITRRIIIGNK